MTFLYLVRHGETDWNLARRIQGSTDIPLNETGRAQARRAGELLARRSWDGIVSSPLSRAYETAEIIGEAIGIPEVEVLDDLVERAYGDAEGLRDHEISLRFPGDTIVPGRETRDAVAARVVPSLLELAGRHPGKNLIVTTHGGVIRTVLNAVSTDAAHHRGIPITNGSIHSFRVTEGALELVAFDDPIETESVQA
ncbi:MAG: histidine phosphatase family protein [Actinomycetota bacterium]